MPLIKVCIKIKDAQAEGDLQKAIDLGNSTTKSYRNIAKESGIKESTLARLKKLGQNGELKNNDKKTFLAISEETELVKYISIIIFLTSQNLKLFG